MYPFLLENEYFSSVWPTWRPHVSRENGHRKRIFFSPEWRFLKTPASHLRVDGLKQRFSASMIIHFMIYFSHDVCYVKASFHAYDSVKIKNRSRKQSHKRDGIGVGRIRTFPFSSNSVYDSVAYDLVKTRLSDSEAKAER